MKKPMKPGDMYNAHKMKKTVKKAKAKKAGKKKLTMDSLKSTAKAMSGMPKAFARNMVGGDARAMLSKRKMKKGMKNC